MNILFYLINLNKGFIADGCEILQNKNKILKKRVELLQGLYLSVARDS